MTPDPTPDDGICPKPRDARPSELMVTTESRTAATTSVSFGAGAVLGLEAAAATAGAPAGAADGPDRSGPATRAAVPPAASIAESRTTAAIPRIPPPRARCSRPPVWGDRFEAALDGALASFAAN